MGKLAIMVVFLMLFAMGCKTVDVGSEPVENEGVEMVITSEPQDTAVIEEADEGTGMQETPEVQGLPEEVPEDTGASISTSLGEDKCDEAASLGFISCLRDGDDLEITLRNVGRGDLQGVYERFYDRSYNQIGASPDLLDFNMGEEYVFEVPMSEFPYTWKVDIHPVQGNDICSNQQIVIIPDTNCR